MCALSQPEVLFVAILFVIYGFHAAHYDTMDIRFGLSRRQKHVASTRLQEALDSLDIQVTTSILWTCWRMITVFAWGGPTRA